MPIYTYQCEACGTVLEKRQSFSDAPLTTCEACSGELRKLLHPVGIVFKGSGFYNTDYRGNGAAKTPETAKAEGKAEGSDGAAAASKNGSSDSTSDSKATSDSKTTSTPTKTETSAAGAKSE